MATIAAITTTSVLIIFVPVLEWCKSVGKRRDAAERCDKVINYHLTHRDICLDDLFEEEPLSKDVGTSHLVGLTTKNGKEELEIPPRALAATERVGEILGDAPPRAYIIDPRRGETGVFLYSRDHIVERNTIRIRKGMDTAAANYIIGELQEKLGFMEANSANRAVVTRQLNRIYNERRVRYTDRRAITPIIMTLVFEKNTLQLETEKDYRNFMRWKRGFLRSIFKFQPT